MVKARHFILPVFLLCAMPAWAVAGFDAKQLGRLFTDAQQREKIDRLRSRHGEPPEKAAASQAVKLSGYVKRANGKSVVWVNNKSTLNGSRVGNVMVHPSSVGKDNRVTIIVDGKRQRLKPGQTWHKDTGTIRE
ncbi:MAG TPA: hypothetical protein ENJ64_06790 [Thiotrichales bacterium]|nr:hypothetical protein [Thiotrichales bacterium]